MARHTFVRKNVNTVFVVKNISQIHKTIKIFGLSIGHLKTYDLLLIPEISEADIRHSLLKGEIKAKIIANDIEIISSNIDLTQYDEEQLNFLNSAGINTGTGQSLINLDGYALLSDLYGYALLSDLDGYVSSSDLDDYALLSDLYGYALLSDLDGYVSNSDLEKWDDIRVPITATIKNGVRDPDFNIFKGETRIYSFGNEGIENNEEELFFTVQIPHSYKEGTDIIPHIHWAPSTTDLGTVRWGLEYTWANYAGDFAETTIIYSNSETLGTSHQHLVGGFENLSGTGKEISSMLICRLFRNSSNINDTYDYDSFVLEFDFHFQSDSVGSSAPFVK